MARRKNFKKLKLPSPIFFVTFACLASLLILGKWYLYNSTYFKLRFVETSDAFLDQRNIRSIAEQLLDRYKGRNIFTINLKNVAASLRHTYPDAKEVIVRIALPDKLVVSMRFRKPVALLRSARLYPIDEEGYVLPDRLAPLAESLPVIEGARPSSVNLKLALELLKEIEASSVVSEYGVVRIDAKDPRNLSFSLLNDVEIRIGYESFRERLQVLEKTLRDPRLVMDRIQYIDVRFEEVVIGPR